MSEDAKERDEYTISMAIEFAKALGQSLILVNGGAAVAMLAFYGQAAANGVVITPTAARALIYFGVGTAVTLIMHLLAYLSLVSIGGRFETMKWANRAEAVSNVTAIAAVIATLTAIAFFVGGMVCAARALSAIST